MVGRLAFPFDIVPFQGMLFNFEGMGINYNCKGFDKKQMAAIFPVVIFSHFTPLISFTEMQIVESAK